jgi:ABC-type transport system involved in multi-copper enzyme maturation permease subunit
MKILAIAKNAYKESVRQPIFYLLLIVSAFLIYFSQFLVFFSFGQESKMIKDMGLATVTMCGLLLALFSSSTVIAKEMEKQTAITVLTKPLSRTQFILGKFLGIISSIFIAMLVLTLVFILTLYQPPSLIYAGKIVAKNIDFSILPGIFLAYFQAVVITAISVAISTRMGMVPNIILSSFIFVLGHLSNYLIGFFAGKDFWVRVGGKIFYLVIPNLENFNVSDAIAVGTPVPIGYLLSAAFYGAIYAAIALLAAIALFRDREIR